MFHTSGVVSVYILTQISFPPFRRIGNERPRDADFPSVALAGKEQNRSDRWHRALAAPPPVGFTEQPLDWSRGWYRRIDVAGGAVSGLQLYRVYRWLARGFAVKYSGPVDESNSVSGGYSDAPAPNGTLDDEELTELFRGPASADAAPLSVLPVSRALTHRHRL